MGPESDLGFLSEALGRTEQEHPSYCTWSSCKGPNSPTTRPHTLFSSSERKAWNCFPREAHGAFCPVLQTLPASSQRPPQARPGTRVWSHYHAFSSIIQHGSSPSITSLLEQLSLCTCQPPLYTQVPQARMEAADPASAPDTSSLWERQRHTATGTRE